MKIWSKNKEKPKTNSTEAESKSIENIDKKNFDQPRQSNREKLKWPNNHTIKTMKQWKLWALWQ